MAPLWVSSCTLLMCGEAGSDHSELLRVGNFRGLSAGTVDGLLDGIFPDRGLSVVPKDKPVHLVDLYLFGMLRHSKVILAEEWC